MCGIGGFFKYGDEPIDKNAIKVLGCALERRGNHATGVAYIKDSDLKVLKAPLPAWKFFASEAYDAFEADMPEDVDIVLVHTRLATQGSPHKNNNNHPMYAGKCAVVHNGMVSNDDFLFRNSELPRLAETDSDIIRAIVDEKGLTPEAVTELNKLSGSVAAGIVHPDFPRKVMLLRSGSPLVLGWDADRRQLMWASEKDMLHTASRIPQQFLNTYFQGNKSPLYFQTVLPNTAYIFSREANGLEWHGEFKSANYYNSPCYRVWDNYEESMAKRWGVAMPKEPVTVMRRDETHKPTKFWCRNPRCGRVLDIDTPELRNLPLAEIECKACKTLCAEASVQ